VLDIIETRKKLSTRTKINMFPLKKKTKWHPFNTTTNVEKNKKSSRPAVPFPNHCIASPAYLFI
jgi:hypothetical protein